MNPVTSTVIDLTEFVYDLDVPKKEWIPSLLEVGRPLFDHGYGVLGMTYMRPPEGGMPTPSKFCQSGGPSDLPERRLMGSTLADEELLRELSQAMADASICGLGSAAARAIQTALAHFREDLVGSGARDE